VPVSPLARRKEDQTFSDLNGLNPPEADSTGQPENVSDYVYKQFGFLF
jgi:hypothetical protein